MRILLVNKFHYLRGGSEKYYFDLANLLKEKGHDIAFFSMMDEKNIKTGCKEYFVNQIDLNTVGKLKAFDIIYSKENARKMEEALVDFKPDVVHLNNFQRQLSSSIISPIKKKNIPIVFTAHDLQAICPASIMLDNQKDVCEMCVGGKYSNCIKKKCNKGSKLKSILGAIEGQYYRNRKIYKNKIDVIISPSNFYRTKFIRDGVSSEKVVAMSNFVDTKQYNVEIQDDGYALYIGRLSKEKGILNLINAFSKLDAGRLYIAGDGPERENIERIVHKNNLEKRVRLLGFLSKEEVIEWTRKSRFTVIPSIGYENCPYSVLETFAIGKPVIGADIAGIPELVKNNYSGFIYKYDDINDLACKMKILFENEKIAKEFGDNAKKQAEEMYEKDVYYKKLMDIYCELIKGRK